MDTEIWKISKDKTIVVLFLTNLLAPQLLILVISFVYMRDVHHGYFLYNEDIFEDAYDEGLFGSSKFGFLLDRMQD